MVVHDFGGKHEVNSDAKLDAVLAARYGDGVNEIWMCHVALYPALNILAKKDLACVHYFPEEFDPGYQSLSPIGNLAPKGSTEFFVNTPTEPVYVLNGAIVPFSLARQAAKEFAGSPKLPSCIKWLRLLEEEP